MSDFLPDDGTVAVEPVHFTASTILEPFFGMDACLQPRVLYESVTWVDDAPPPAFHPLGLGVGGFEGGSAPNIASCAVTVSNYGEPLTEREYTAGRWRICWPWMAGGPQIWSFVNLLWGFEEQRVDASGNATMWRTPGGWVSSWNEARPAGYDLEDANTWPGSEVMYVGPPSAPGVPTPEEGSAASAIAFLSIVILRGTVGYGSGAADSYVDAPGLIPGRYSFRGRYWQEA